MGTDPALTDDTAPDDTPTQDAPADTARRGLRAWLADPRARLLAAFVGIPRVEVVQIVAYAGYDL